MHNWWDHGKYEGVDSDSRFAEAENKQAVSPVKWCIAGTNDDEEE